MTSQRQSLFFVCVCEKCWFIGDARPKARGKLSYYPPIPTWERFRERERASDAVQRSDTPHNFDDLIH